jgi:hypothetical protein
MTDIQELYSRITGNPLDVTNKDINDLIADLRGKKRNFDQSAVPAKSPAKTKAAPKESGPALDFDIEL